MKNHAVSGCSSRDKFHQELCQDKSPRIVMRMMPEIWQYCATWIYSLSQNFANIVLPDYIHWTKTDANIVLPEYIQWAKNVADIHIKMSAEKLTYLFNLIHAAFFC